MTSKWARWRLKSPASRLFTQPFIQAQIKEIIKAPRHWPLCGEFTGDQWIPHTNGQLRWNCFHSSFIRWRYHFIWECDAVDPKVFCMLNTSAVADTSAVKKPKILLQQCIYTLHDTCFMYDGLFSKTVQTYCYWVDETGEWFVWVLYYNLLI